MKMNIYFKMFAVCCFIVFAAACKKSEQPTFTKSDFPILKIGDWWLYKVTDQISHDVDTVKVTIIGSSATGQYVAFSENGQHQIDSAFFVLSDNGFLYSSVSYPLPYSVKFPFSAGDKWTAVSYTSYLPALQVFDKSYPAYGITSLSPSLEGTDTMTSYISAGLGLVEQDYHIVGINSERKISVQLIYYHSN